MSDIVDGLRSVSGDTTGIAKAAAHEIERLRARVAELEAALSAPATPAAEVAVPDDVCRHCLPIVGEELARRCPVQHNMITATPADLRRIQSVASSYAGHLQHANHHRLTTSLHRRFPWLESATRRRRFDYRLEGQPITIQLYKEASRG